MTKIGSASIFVRSIFRPSRAISMSQRIRLMKLKPQISTAMAMRRAPTAKRLRTSSPNQPDTHIPSQKRGIQGRSL